MTRSSNPAWPLRALRFFIPRKPDTIRWLIAYWAFMAGNVAISSNLLLWSLVRGEPITFGEWLAGVYTAGVAAILALVLWGSHQRTVWTRAGKWPDWANSKLGPR